MSLRSHALCALRLCLGEYFHLLLHCGANIGLGSHVDYLLLFGPTACHLPTNRLSVTLRIRHRANDAPRGVRIHLNTTYGKLALLLSLALSLSRVVG